MKTIVLLFALIFALIFASSANAERATFYGGERHHNFCGRKTASGHIYNCAADMTAAHCSVPLGTRVRLCGPGGCATVLVNDRGPCHFDLSMRAAEAICGGLTSCNIRKGSWGL